MGCPFIEWKWLHSRWKSTAEKPWAPEEPMGVSFEASVQPVSLCPNCSRWGSDTVSRLASMHRCMLRRCVGSTGAEEFYWSIQTSSLEHRTLNAPVLWFRSVGSTGAEEKLKSTKTCSLEQRTFIAPVLTFLTIGSTGAILDFSLHPEEIDRQGVGPSAMHRMLRCLGTGSTGAADFLCFQLFWLGFECDFDCCFFQELCWLLLTIFCCFWVSVQDF